MIGLMPIETIPKNGTTILIKTHVGMVSAWYDNEAGDWVCYDDMFSIYGCDIEGWLPYIEED